MLGKLTPDEIEKLLASELPRSCFFAFTAATEAQSYVFLLRVDREGRESP